jgi:hypothetical protein
MHDIYGGRRPTLHELEEAISLHDRQIGAVAAIPADRSRNQGGGSFVRSPTERSAFE